MNIDELLVLNQARREFDMTISKLASQAASAWRNSAEAGNPAGDLFASGKFAEADMVGRTVGGSGRCGTACTGSTVYQCC